MDPTKSRADRRHAMPFAEAVRAGAERLGPEDTGEMRIVLATLLETEAHLTQIAQRLLRSN